MAYWGRKLNNRALKKACRSPSYMIRCNITVICKYYSIAYYIIVSYSTACYIVPLFMMGYTVSGCLRALSSCSTSEANGRTAASLTWSLHPTMLHRAETARIPAAIAKRQV